MEFWVETNPGQTNRPRYETIGRHQPKRGSERMPAAADWNELKVGGELVWIGNPTIIYY